MIMHKVCVCVCVWGGGGGHTQISWLAYNIVHGMASKQNVCIYICNVKKIKQKTELFSRPIMSTSY